MAAIDAWELRMQHSADGAQGQRDSASLYAADARYAYQRRLDTFSQQEALAAQTSTTSRIASDAMQLRTGVQTPPVIVKAA